MYEADIEYAMKVHPWRKVLDQCFVTRRSCYEQCGGLQPEFGHFSEWVLAARYFRLGYKIEYLPEARLHHYYIGDLAELRKFTRDFVRGEIRYFGRSTPQHGQEPLLEVPPEWICQGSWNPQLARILVRNLARELLDPRAMRRRPSAPSITRIARSRMLVASFIRWLPPAMVGIGGARGAAVGKLLGAFAAAKVLTLLGSTAQLSSAFRNYIAALIEHQRLQCISQQDGGQAAGTGGGPAQEPTRFFDAFAPDNAGFYPLEAFDGGKLRWSETVAVMPARLPAGVHRIKIECAPVRPLTHGTDLKFYFNERRLSAQEVSIAPHSIDIELSMAQSGDCTLAWTCLPFPATADRRWLGLPITQILWDGCGAARKDNAWLGLARTIAANTST